MKRPNQQQLAFIRSTAKNTSLAAGPGTGKTFALTLRIAEDTDLTTGGRLVCITFTEAGAEALKNRLADLGVQISFVGTIHAYALMMLKTYGGRLGYQPDIEVVDDDYVLSFVKTILEVSGLKKAKPAEVMRLLATPDIGSGAIQNVARRTLQMLREKSVATFDTMMSDFFHIIGDTPPIDHLYMDEAQDFSDMDWLIIDHLNADKRTVVGDEDQCIYEWRDASPKRLLEFKGEQMLMTINYRSTVSIIEASNRLIAHNTERRPKTILSARCLHGNAPRLMRHDDAGGMMGLSVQIKRALKIGSVAALSRYNSHWSGNITPDLVRKHVSTCVPMEIDSDENPSPHLHIGTLHSAKGLQYNTVFVIDWTPKTITEEERRLFYVGMTRAENELIIWTKEPSQFCKEAGLV